MEDRRVEKTKRIIDDACWALMREKAFEEITIRDIAQRAKINRATFYRYHADKYDWMEQKLRALARELAQAWTAPRREDALQLHFEQWYEAYAVLLQNKGASVFCDVFKALLLEKCFEDSGLQPGQDPQRELRLYMQVSVVVGALEWWVKNDCPLSIKELIATLP